MIFSVSFLFFFSVFFVWFCINPSIVKVQKQWLKLYRAWMHTGIVLLQMWTCREPFLMKPTAGLCCHSFPSSGIICWNKGNKSTGNKQMHWFRTEWECRIALISKLSFPFCSFWIEERLLPNRTCAKNCNCFYLHCLNLPCIFSLLDRYYYFIIIW